MRVIKWFLTVLIVGSLGLLALPVAADGTYKAQLYGTVTDAGQVVSKMVIDYGEGLKVSDVDKDTFTVHVTTEVAYGVNTGNKTELDRTIEKIEINGGKVTVYFNLAEGGTLTYLSEARNYPAKLTYSITQNKAIKATANDGRELPDIIGNYTCDNSVIDEETAKFKAVTGSQGIDYQYYDAGSDKLIVWFHGNGEGDIADQTGNNVAQMLANRGTVAWASKEAQNIYSGASVMAFQAPDTWYYAQRDKLLEKAYQEIQEVIKKYNINPDKVLVSGCSAGGYMTTRMLIAYPDLFAAAIINCPALDVAGVRGGNTPTDDELASIKNSKTAIWLVQGETDGSVNTENCAKRMFNILTAGRTLKTTKVDQAISSDFTTYETDDQKYLLTLYETVDLTAKTDSLGVTRESGRIKVAEDYNVDGQEEEVKYSDHWTWIFSLNNNPTASDGTHIMNWSAKYLVTTQKTTQQTQETTPSTRKKAAATGDKKIIAIFIVLLIISLLGGIYLKIKKD